MRPTLHVLLRQTTRSTTRSDNHFPRRCAL